MNARAVAEALGGAKPEGDGFKARCPAHEDAHPSLSLKNKPDGGLLVRCRAGCPQGAVLSALRKRGLWPDAAGRRPRAARAGGVSRARRDDEPPPRNFFRPIFPVPEDAPPCELRHGAHGEPSTRFAYRDAAGRLLGLILRWDFTRPDGTRSKEILPATFCEEPEGARAWRFQSFEEPHPLFGLDRLAARPEALVILAEGEKAALGAETALPDCVGVTTPHGANSPHKADFGPLTGRRVAVWPDHDEAGARYAAKAAQRAAEAGAEVRVVRVPEAFPEGWDLGDPPPEGWDAARLRTLLEAAEPVQAPQAGERTTVEREGKDEGRERPQKEVLLDCARDAELWHDPDGEAYATVPLKEHRENHRVRSRAFRDWLTLRFLENGGSFATVPNAQAMEDALRGIEAQARFRGPAHRPARRVAEHGGPLYLDLGNDAWEAVEITADGWRIVSESPLKFLRAKGMLALPHPVRGGSLDDLRPFVNVASEEQFVLLVGFLVMALHPQGPYPILVVIGGQGAAKSTLCKVIRALVDPNRAPLRSPPKEERDVAIAASNGRIVAYNNLSGLSPYLSDALCRLATEGGFATRELYSNDEEAIFDSRRPILVNGIDDLATRGDLADRSVCLALPDIPDEARRDEKEFWASFDAARPRILGALLEAAAAALKNADRVQLARKPRMADFARWVTAAESALPWEPGAFLTAYEGNIERTVADNLEADPVAGAIARFAMNRGAWRGTATELLGALGDAVAEETRRGRHWPKSARAMGNRVRRAAPLLRAQGVVVETDLRGPGKARVRLIRVENGGAASSVASATSKRPDSLARRADARDAAARPSSAPTPDEEAWNRRVAGDADATDDADADSPALSGPDAQIGGDEGEEEWTV